MSLNSSSGSTGGGGGGTFYQIVQDEGVSKPQETTLDFQGAGVMVTSGTGKTIVTISGSSGSSGTPYYIPDGTIFTTSENIQTVIGFPVRNDGIWVIDGIRVFL